MTTTTTPAKTRKPRTPTDKLAEAQRLIGLMNPDEIYKLGARVAIQSPMSADILRRGLDSGGTLAAEETSD